MNKMDAFSRRHPAVNFLYFVLVICFGVTIQHPAYLAAGLLGAAIYYLLLKGPSGIRFLLAILPLLLLVTLVNPIINTRGERILFSLFGRPYTFEALVYGIAVGAMLGIMLVWFGCYNVVMTGDKFTSLFGSFIPSVSLLLVMVLRLVPALIKKAAQISGARRCIGKASGEKPNEKLTDGMCVLSALVSWALEGSIVTGDSMRSRGYGTGKRSSFMIYKMTGEDWFLLVLIALLSAFTFASAAFGGAQADFMPRFFIAPIKGFSALGFCSYCLLLLLPTGLHVKEVLQWHISRSRI